MRGGGEVMGGGGEVTDGGGEETGGGEGLECVICPVAMEVAEWRCPAVGNRCCFPLPPLPRPPAVELPAPTSPCFLR